MQNYRERYMLSMKSLPVTMALVAVLASGIFAQTGDATGSIDGFVTDFSGAAIAGATVMILNREARISQTLTTGKSGDFLVENLPVGNYTVDAWTRYFERSSLTDIKVTGGAVKELRLKLDFCGRRRRKRHQRNFTSQIEVKARSDFEKDLVHKAQGLPCRPDANGWLKLGGPSQRCANLATMKFFSGLVEKNKAGQLPEAGEGPVLSGAYFGATAEPDQATKRWIVKLRLEYSVDCGMLCGINIAYDRWVYFDESGAITKVDDDCGCNLEGIS
jgi:hypothetical protein